MRQEWPLVARDGKRILFVGTQGGAELSAYDFRLREFVPYLGGISAESVSFSKDGEWVAYVRLPEGTLWRMRKDGSGRLQLTFPPIRASLARWSPDGRYLAALTLGDDNLMLFDFKAQRWENLSNMGAAYPSWSENARYVYHYAFSYPYQTVRFYRTEIATRRTEEVASVGDVRLFRGSHGYGWLGVTPEGSPLAARDIGTQEIYALDVDFH